MIQANANTRFESVWDALADNSAEAADLKARSQLMMQLAEHLKFQGWSLEDAAMRCKAPQSEIQSLLNGDLSKFSLSALEAIAAHLEIPKRQAVN